MNHVADRAMWLREHSCLDLDEIRELLEAELEEAIDMLRRRERRDDEGGE